MKFPVEEYEESRTIHDMRKVPSASPVFELCNYTGAVNERLKLKTLSRINGSTKEPYTSSLENTRVITNERVSSETLAI
jgi:hypothetical protein